jgi:adenylosuccinate synthase
MQRDKNHIANLKQAIIDTWWANPRPEGAYVLMDGQFGSTGKGLLASLIGFAAEGIVTKITTNAGPNSGHTGNIPGTDKMVMTQQIPVATVVARECFGYDIPTYLNGGAIIEEYKLRQEITGFDLAKVCIHPCAAVIQPHHVEQDQLTVRGIAGTGKGVGPALAAKVLRQEGKQPKMNVVDDLLATYGVAEWDWTKDVVFVETAQGFSLGVNEHRFYPNTTSRECSVQQAVADARIPVQRVKGVAMCLRTFPIRVGSTENSSGGHYPDQRETSWDELGLPAELTSVTKRVRRVFTWSRIQFKEAVAANEPDILFLNFMNYLETQEEQDDFVDMVRQDYQDVLGCQPDLVLLGYGPRVQDIRID